MKSQRYEKGLQKDDEAGGNVANTLKDIALKFADLLIMWGAPKKKL